jgi:hypothetical protein
MYYIENPLDEIQIKIKNKKIMKKDIYQNKNIFEPSYTIIIELEYIFQSLSINIYYKGLKYDVILQQLNINEHTISAMTLFKDDYELLKKYLSHYHSLGIYTFFLYYNDILSDEIVEFIKKQINTINVKVYLIEWNYAYWWKNSYGNQHLSQTMAINDALHILKNYGNYILYNDVDEYIIDDFFIDNQTDIYVYKNIFCEMTDELIYYKDFYEIFDISKISKEKYIDDCREKNIVRIQNINVMGVHSVFEEFSDKKMIKKIAGKFYHIVNFQEKNRKYLLNDSYLNKNDS